MEHSIRPFLPNVTGVQDTIARNGAHSMQTPSTLSIWLGEQAMPLAIIVVLLSLVMIILYISARNRRVRMNEARSGTNEETFVNSLAVYGFDPMISRTTYQYLQNTQKVSFPIEANDLLDEDLGLDNADVEESIRDLMGSTYRLYQPGLQHDPIVIVEDLVRFIQASPRLAERAA